MGLCTNCGNEMRKGVNFCGVCGKKKRPESMNQQMSTTPPTIWILCGIGIVIFIIFFQSILSDHPTPSPKISEPMVQTYSCQDGTVVTSSSDCPPKKPKFKPFKIKLFAIGPGGYPENFPQDFADIPTPSQLSVELFHFQHVPGPTYIDNPKNPPGWGLLIVDITTDNELQDEMACTISEYYENVLNGVSKSTLSPGESNFAHGPFIRNWFYFEENKKPDYARYDVQCRGVESGFTATASIHVNLQYQP